MLDAFSAEALKLRRHRATWFLVWIFPIAALVLYSVAILVQLGRGLPPSPVAPALDSWLDNAANFWSLPRSGFGRIMVTAYVAVVFAGEYAWNTWKLIVPHRARASLIAAKFAVSLLLVYAAFFAAALLVNFLGWLPGALKGDAMPEGITAGGIAAAHLKGLAASLPGVLLSAAIAALAAILTRTTAAAIVIGIVVITLEQLFTTFGPVLSLYLPGVVEGLYNALPGYHLGNLTGWILDGSGRIVPFPNETTIAWGWEGSLAIVTAWIGGLMALSFWRFGRQDIN
mgnify:CR=1 FL=1